MPQQYPAYGTPQAAAYGAPQAVPAPNPVAPAGYGTMPYQTNAGSQFHEQPVEQLDPIAKCQYACTIVAQLFTMLREKRVSPSAYMMVKVNDFLASCGYQRLR